MDEHNSGITCKLHILFSPHSLGYLIIISSSWGWRGYQSTALLSAGELLSLIFGLSSQVVPMWCTHVTLHRESTAHYHPCHLELVARFVFPLSRFLWSDLIVSPPVLSR